MNNIEQELERLQAKIDVLNAVLQEHEINNRINHFWNNPKETYEETIKNKIKRLHEQFNKEEAKLRNA
jgi:N-formylglutamate amidohydrolase